MGLIDPGSERLYAEVSRTWMHNQKTEDELLQRIWNLSEALLKACAEIETLREDLESAENHIDFIMSEIGGTLPG